MKKKLTSLEDHNNWQSSFSNMNLNSNEPVPNGIACPKCGNEMVDSEPMVILTSNPAQKNVACQDKDCGFTGYRVA